MQNSEHTNKFSSHQIFEHLPIGFLAYNNNFDIFYVNETFKILYDNKGNQKELKLGGKVYDLEIFKEANFVKLKENITNYSSFESVIYNIVNRNGHEIILVLKGVPFIKDSSFLGGALIIEDIVFNSKEVKSDRLTSGQYDEILGNCSDFTVITDNYGGILHIPQYSQKNVFSFISSSKASNIGNLFSEEINSQLISFFRNDQVSLNIRTKFEVNLNLIYTNVKVRKIKSQLFSKEAVLFLFYDSTEQIIEKELKESELNSLALQKGALLHSLGGVLYLNNFGIIKNCNNIIQDYLLIAKNELIEKTLWSIIPSFSSEKFNYLKAEISAKEIIEDEISITINGIKSYFKYSFFNFIDLDKGTDFLLTLKEITNDKLIELELKESEEFYREIVNVTNDYLIITDISGSVNFVSPNLVRELSYNLDEFLLLNISEIVFSKSREEKKLDFERLLNERIQLENCIIIGKNKNNIIPVNINSKPVFNIDGTLKYTVFIFNHLDEVDRLSEQIKIFKTIFETVPLGIALLEDNKVIMLNISFAIFLGRYYPEELIGIYPFEEVVQQDRQKVKEYFEKIDNINVMFEPLQVDYIKPDNTPVLLEISAEKIQIGALSYVLCVLRDITQLNSEINSVKFSEERFSTITEDLPIALWLSEKINNKIRLTFCSKNFLNITGYNSEEFIDSPSLWYRIIHLDDIDSVFSKFKSLLRIKEKNTDILVYRIYDKLGKLKWIENKIYVYKTDEGVSRVSGIISDVTAQRKQIESIQIQNEELRQQNAAKDRFISIISHDLRTPFSSIVGFTDILMNDATLTEDKKFEYIDYIHKSSKNLFDMVTALLDYTRIQTGRIKFEPRRINVLEVIKKSLSINSGAAIKKNIRLYTELEYDIFIHADSNLILQVFNNLVSNAIKFTNDSGFIKIEAEPFIEARVYQFTVRDNGIGIKEEDIHKLFNIDEKFSEKGTKGEIGTGLGLSLCKEIVKLHGGEIDVETVYGEGSAFKFTLPVSSTTILLVEDSKTDRILYTKIISNLIPGYKIVEAKDGGEALKIIENISPALIISDHSMHPVSGFQFAEEIIKSDRKYIPPLIILSAYLGRELKNEYRKLGIEYIFSKPVELNLLKSAIEKSLKKGVFI